ncbi:MAG: hypothetical protein ABIH85_08775, partial [Candidatus Omnitrophota bacterium]
VIVLDNGQTIETTGDMSFKTLIIGDGTGETETTLILKHDINPASGSIIVRKGGNLVQANSREQMIMGDLKIEDGGVLTHQKNDDKKDYVLDFSAENIILEDGAVATANGLGYAGGAVRAIAKGQGGGKYLEMGSAGGSYGGRGGSAKTQVIGTGMDRYGEERMPSDLGSGGAGGWFAEGGAGGGSITLKSRKNFDISGTISADGEDGKLFADETEYQSAGGAGGSVYLTADLFLGDGAKIVAEGGSGRMTAGGGAGGRVHLKAPAGEIRGILGVKGGEGFIDGAGGSLIVE